MWNTLTLILRAGVICVIPVMAACNALVTVHRPVVLPAEINLVGYHDVVFEPIKQGAAGDRLVAQLRAALAENSFTIHDQGLEARQKDLILANGGSMSDEDWKKADLAEAGIRCRIVKHEIINDIQWTTGQDKRGVSHTWYTLKAHAEVEVSVEMYKINNLNQVFIARLIKAHSDVAKSEADDRSKLSVAPDPLYSEAYSRVVQQFVNYIAPHEANLHVAVCRVTTKGQDQTERGLSFLQAGEYADAREAFEKSLEWAKTQPKVEPIDIASMTYDIGTTYEFEGNFGKAIDTFKKAIEIHPGPKVDSGNAIDLSGNGTGHSGNGNGNWAQTIRAVVASGVGEVFGSNRDDLFAQGIATCKALIDAQKKFREQQGIEPPPVAASVPPQGEVPFSGSIQP